MEAKKHGGSSSPFPSELFGIKEPSKTDVFASIFPPLKGAGSWQKQHLENQHWNTKQGFPDSLDKNRKTNKDESSIFQEERVEPCCLFSSLHYGGQEMYYQSPTTQTSGSYAGFDKDAREDDPSGNSSYSASRGNWWEGSLYY
ncbi:hypothetical protein Nepgr_014572 [Nepenthes gracilis]|uniref:Uncharacterized protein n=1 Tax=Nepenthes gracilis TaxID=150966 RepID=A0AAD3SM34_NEPGR|nr:hypothetical protein Nepgr_014572 [Nepenthes gracilis]